MADLPYPLAQRKAVLQLSVLMGVSAVREGSCSFPNLSKILLNKAESLGEEEKGVGVLRSRGTLCLQENKEQHLP